MSTRRRHWESVYQDRDPTSVSWYQQNPARSLILIEETGIALDDPVIDVGGGASHLVDRLQAIGFADLTVLDVAPAALAHAQQRLGPRARDVRWLDADVLTHDFDRSYVLWHDRAVFHFLTDATDRARYVGQIESSVIHGGHVIIAGFALDGPEKCSGLPVHRHSSETLAAELGGKFEPVTFQEEAHHTPRGAVQHFLYGRFRRLSD
jgi:SAM-dependent methyltransferase